MTANACGSNFTDFDLTDSSCPSALLRTLWANGKWEILLYSVIFLLSVLGNALVILTLSKNHRMSTITNVLLLNLAASDLVLAVLCMPFTLVGTLLRDFIFGSWMCKLIPFLQATSVAASVWTLVALSVERYHAICHPLRSRKRKAQSRARRLIGSIWVGGALSTLPITVFSELQPIKNGRHKCRENWPNGEYEKVYNLFLDLLLLVIPLVVLAATYCRIANTLRKDLKRNRCCLRHTNYERSLICKRRVIKMLFAVVLEFFICWTPLYVINTLALFAPHMVYGIVGYKTISFCQLLAYTSGCCNPITYCFMNKGFRNSFVNTFTCGKQ